MSEIKIPFRDDMANAIRNHKKIATRRTKVYGKIGDIFLVGWADHYIVCELTEIYQQKLGLMTEKDAKEEGVKNLDEFGKLWWKIHFKKGFDSNQIVWVHKFKIIEEDDI